GTYKTVGTQPIPLNVAPAAVAALPPQAGPAPEEESTAPELAPLTPHLGRARPPPVLWTTQAWFIALSALPWIAWGGARTWNRWRDRTGANRESRRRRAREKRLDEGFATLKACASEGDAGSFF